ncbi:hypothetical protein VA249_37040 [Vibrio alfacsensis]|nr:hypothetical protein VA249_37040 [Vibrio alfacsensis]
MSDKVITEHAAKFEVILNDKKRGLSMMSIHNSDRTAEKVTETYTTLFGISIDRNKHLD